MDRDGEFFWYCTTAGCLFMEKEIYYNSLSQKYIFSLGFRHWATQALPVQELRVGGKALGGREK